MVKNKEWWNEFFLFYFPSDHNFGKGQWWWKIVCGPDEEPHWDLGAQTDVSVQWLTAAWI